MSQSVSDRQVLPDGRSALWLAADRGDLAEVDRLISNGAKLNKRQRNRWTPLTAAAWRGHTRVVNRLISAGALLNPREEFGATPLYMAAQNGRIATVARLIAAGANVDLPNNRGWTPLHISAQYGHVRVAKLLVKAGANLYQQAEDGFTSMYVAAQNTHLAFVRLLLLRAEEDACSVGLLNLPAHDGSTPVFVAAQNGHASVIDALISAGADHELPDCAGASPLWTAADHGHKRAVLRLLKAGAKVDRCDNAGVSPLQAAAANGHLEVTRLLLKHGATVDLASTIVNNSPLAYASLNGHAECVRELLRAGADLNRPGFEGCSALYLASQGGHSRVVEILLNSGARPDERNCFGCTPLWIASREGHLAVVVKLLSFGAAVSIMGEGHLTPLGIAVRSGHISVIDALSKAGSNLNRVDAFGTSPILLAIDMRQEQAAVRLLDAGVKTDAVDKNGMSPLWLAAQTGCAKVFNYLLHRTRKNRQRMTRQLLNRFCTDEFKCFRYACFRGQAEILASLSELQLWKSCDFVKLSNLLSSEPFVDEFKKFLVEKTSRSSKSLVSRLADDLPKFSIRLHQSLLRSGFCRANSVLQSGCAAVLESIVRKHNQAAYFVVGSYADGWGNCLTRLNGRIEVGSDIDLMCIEIMPPFHILGCAPSQLCTQVDCVPVEYSDGHIHYRVHVSSPSVPDSGSLLKPAVDHVTTYPCCSYPTIRVLQADHKSQIRPSVLRQLSEEVQLARCHVVAAAPPGLAGDRMRVSTNLLERKLMQSLTSIQGQVFVILKYLIKKVIGQRVKGLKSYHAKNILFYMLDKTPEQEWQRPGNLVSLVKQSLIMLEKQLRQPSSSAMHCMRHFFLRDAAIYLHKGHDEKFKIAQEVSQVIDNLLDLLVKFGQNLIPTDTGSIEFHPFLYLPQIPATSGKLEVPIGKIKYYNIYQLVYTILVQLFTDADKRRHHAELLKSISRIPDSARTTRECLKALALLKAGQRFDASRLSSTASRTVGHINASSISIDDAQVLVWKQLKTTDSAWKFSFTFKQTDTFLPVFQFLPQQIRQAFPFQLPNYDDSYYMNFDALIKALQLEFSSSNCQASELFTNAINGDSDPQELLMLLHYCRPGEDDQYLVQAVHNNRDLITESMLNALVVHYIESRPSLQAMSIKMAMTAHSHLKSVSMIKQRVSKRKCSGTNDDAEGNQLGKSLKFDLV